MKFAAGCELSYDVKAPATALFNIRPAQTPQQHVHDERFEVTPAVAIESVTTGSEGNRFDRLLLDPGPVTLRYDCVVDLAVNIIDPLQVLEVPPALLPVEVMQHLMSSRYCEADRFSNVAHKLFSDDTRGHLRVTGICNWIHDHIDYLRGASDSHTSAIDTLTDRAGVCRDFAHLGISFCRALGIPARFASAYALGLDPPDFHAVFEAWLGDRWYLFDPTRQAALDGVLRIGVGSDAAQVAFANFWGGPVEPSGMQVWIRPLGTFDESAPRTTAAVSLTSS